MVVEPGGDCVKIYDKKPPDDDCVLGVSYHHWPAVGNELSVASLARSSLAAGERPVTLAGPIVEETRIDLVLAWGEGRSIDPRTSREACARLCIARKDEIQAILTLDFWPSDLERCDAHWRAFLSTLQLGQWVADPRKGPVLS